MNDDYDFQSMYYWDRIELAPDLHFHGKLTPIRPRKWAALENEARTMFFNAKSFKERIEWYARMQATAQINVKTSLTTHTGA
jgi:hypothetical protein